MSRLLNLVRFVSGTTGSGSSMAVGAVVSGFLSPADAGAANGESYYLAIEDGANREIGIWTYSTTGPTFTRTSVLDSTNAGAAITRSGTAQAFITPAAEAIPELASRAEVAARTNTARVSPVNLLPFSPGHLFGLTLSNNATDSTNDVDIATGSARDSTDVENIILASALTKRLDAGWAVGNGNGGLDTGAIANATYFVWLIKRSDTGVVDVLFSTSATAPTMPTNYDYKRRIGAILRESAAIVPFSQSGDEFLRSVPILDVSANNPGTAAVLRTLSVPVGIKVEAIVSIQSINLTADAITNVLLTSPDQADTTPTLTINTQRLPALPTSPQNIATSVLRVRTNTSAQVRSRQDASDADHTFRMVTFGWIDARGRLA